MKFLEFLSSWRELITKVYVEDTLAAALVTIVAVAAFFRMKRWWKGGPRWLHGVVVVFAWAVAVPIVGFLMDVLRVVWGAVTAVLPILVTLTGSLYGIYERHPYMVLAIVVLGGIGYFVQRLWYSSRALRVSVSVVAVVLVAHLAAPIADRLVPERQSPASEDSPQNSKSLNSKPPATEVPDTAPIDGPPQKDSESVQAKPADSTVARPTADSTSEGDIRLAAPPPLAEGQADTVLDSQAGAPN
jgi:hypothetical protein